MKTRKGTARGQVFTTDLILASVVFLFILTLFITYSGQVQNRTQTLDADHARTRSALWAAEALVGSPGEPANWEYQSSPAGMTGLGMARSKNELDPRKVQKIAAWSSTYYDEIRDLLGTSRYGLSVQVIEMRDQNVLASFGTPPGARQEASAVNRLALYQGKRVIVRVRVFE